MNVQKKTLSSKPANTQRLKLNQKIKKDQSGKFNGYAPSLTIKMRYYDDVTGKEIKAELVLKARAEQLGKSKSSPSRGKYLFKTAGTIQVKTP